MRVLFILLFLFPSCFLGQNTYSNAVKLFDQEKFDLAKPIFKRFLEENPNHIKTKEYLGDIAGYQKDWDLAMAYYEPLLEKDDTNADYHFKFGGALGMKALEVSKIRALTYIGEIGDHFKTAAKLDPNHIEARWALVEFYIQLPGIVGGSEKKAIRYANELLKISPVDGYLSNGYIAEYSDRPEDAERFYKEAIRVGGSPHTYEKLANHYEKNEQPMEAIEIAEKSLEIHQRNHLNYQIGKIVAQYNLDSERGISCLQAYIENHSAKDGVPKDWAYYRLAQIYMNIGKKHTALTWIDKALASRPDFKEALVEKKRILTE